MRIKKKHQSEYVRVDGVWVRNPCSSVSPRDINNLTRGDEAMLLQNETLNRKRMFRQVGDFNWRNVVIVSDGYDFKEKQKALAELPYKDIKIICVNRSLANWHMLGNSKLQRMIDMYVVNNPHIECLSYLPKHGYWPNLLASTRTQPQFIDQYRGEVFFYGPAPNDSYTSPFSETEVTLDDYRNPICAAISFARHVKAQKLLLFCCDDSFDKERPASIKLDNGLWSYPAQLKAQNIIDAQLGWLTKSGIEVASHSSGLKYSNAAYIPIEGIRDFFMQETNE
jgi:hypothetical protein